MLEKERALISAARQPYGLLSSPWTRKSVALVGESNRWSLSSDTSSLSVAAVESDNAHWKPSSPCYSSAVRAAVNTADHPTDLPHLTCHIESPEYTPSLPGQSSLPGGRALGKSTYSSVCSSAQDKAVGLFFEDYPVIQSSTAPKWEGRGALEYAAIEPLKFTSYPILNDASEEDEELDIIGIIEMYEYSPTCPNKGEDDPCSELQPGPNPECARQDRVGSILNTLRLNSSLLNLRHKASVLVGGGWF